MQRYERLLRQALQLTGRNKELAEDVVHDAYIQFTVARPDLRSIGNVDAYLYGMVRKLHMSQLRRATRLQYCSSFLVDYDSLEIGLRAIDLGAQIRVQDELRLICRYACIRKHSSKAGSVLLLRFFHGYYPSEIAQILIGPRSAVDDWLRIARREAKLYIEDPHSLNFMDEGTAAEPQVTFGQTIDSVMNASRRQIFETRHRVCLPREQIKTIYGSRKSSALDSSLLEQIVSCPQCLDLVNQVLALPQLAERFPLDMLGPAARSVASDAREKGQS
ncbi:MAG TPA: RNA polymerase sigma factor [Pyrinomonadaceae bacterium]|nr:RNA polymerase sigma factor [Pyrinomonadaceae bacterium]